MRLLRWPLFAVIALTIAAIGETPIHAQEQLGSAFGEITLGKSSTTGGNYSRGGAFFNVGGMLGGRFHKRERSSLIAALSFERTINVATGDDCVIDVNNPGKGCQPEAPEPTYVGLLFGVEPHCENLCFNLLAGPGFIRASRNDRSAKALGLQGVAELNLQLFAGFWLAVSAKGISIPNFSDPSQSSYIKPHTALFSKSLNIGFRIQEH